MISQSVACSQHHSIEQRLARCLLTMNHYAGSGEFLLDQSSIATLLGVRRVGISAAARKLQAAALIRYRRGRISVLDARGLGKKSCECYRFIRTQYELLHVDLPRLLLYAGSRAQRSIKISVPAAPWHIRQEPPVSPFAMSRSRTMDCG